MTTYFITGLKNVLIGDEYLNLKHNYFDSPKNHDEKPEQTKN